MFGRPGYEVGPIRPPSEADSLLIRVTRNCNWNRCAFCPVYKGAEFELRELEDIKADVRTAAQIHGDIFKSAFLQDADSLIMGASEIAEIIRLIKSCFPSITRLTTYGRSSTIAKLTLDDLRLLKDAGLTRIHIGLESGSIAVLRLVKKGANPKVHIKAGKLVKEAGLSLSEYVMPGLGGKALWEEHAVETAKVLNAIDPDFIRIRSLFIPPGIPLSDLKREGKFEPLEDDRIVDEQKLFVETLDGIASRIVSDHSLNLLMELNGRMPDDKPRLLSIIERYQSLPDRERLLFRLGRRVGILVKLDHLENPSIRTHLEAILEKIEQDADGDVDTIINQMLTRYI
ncbi:radical SAM protein [Acidobacteriota bacterium]